MAVTEYEMWNKNPPSMYLGSLRITEIGEYK